MFQNSAILATKTTPPPLPSSGLVALYDAGNSSSLSSPTGTWNNLQGGSPGNFSRAGSILPQFVGNIGAGTGKAWYNYANTGNSQAQAYHRNNTSDIWRRVGDRNYAWTLFFVYRARNVSGTGRTLYTTWNTGLRDAFAWNNRRHDIVSLPNNDADYGAGWSIPNIFDDWLIESTSMTPRGSNTTGRMFQNGVNLGEADPTYANGVNWQNTYAGEAGRIGANLWSNSSGLNGDIAVFGAYNRELSIAEHQQLYRALEGFFQN